MSGYPLDHFYVMYIDCVGGKITECKKQVIRDEKKIVGFNIRSIFIVRKEQLISLMYCRNNEVCTSKQCYVYDFCGGEETRYMIGYSSLSQSLRS